MRVRDSNSLEIDTTQIRSKLRCENRTAVPNEGALPRLEEDGCCQFSKRGGLTSLVDAEAWFRLDVGQWTVFEERIATACCCLGACCPLLAGVWDPLAGVFAYRTWSKREFVWRRSESIVGASSKVGGALTLFAGVGVLRCAGRTDGQGGISCDGFQSPLGY